MIPVLVLAVVLTGCKNNESPTARLITPEQRAAAIESAMEYLDAGNVKEALAITTTLITREHITGAVNAESQETYALVLLAHAEQLDMTSENELAESERRKALDAYIATCDLLPQPGLLELSTAQLAHMLGELEVARDYYIRSHQSTPKDGRASFFIAQMAMLDNDWGTAQKWINESMERNENEPFTLLSSGLIEAQLGNFKTALLRASQGCKIKPDDSSLRFMQARVIRLAGNPAQAMDILGNLPKDFRNSPLVQDEINTCVEAYEELVNTKGQEQ